MLFLFIKKFGDALFFSRRGLRHVLAALRFKMTVETFKIFELRHRHKMIPTGITDRVFNVTFLLRLTHAAEMVTKKKMRLNAQKLARRFRTATAHDLANRNFRIIELDQCRNATEKMKGPFQALLKTLRAFDGKNLKITNVAVRQGQLRISELRHHASDLCACKAEIELGFTRRMLQRNIKRSMRSLQITQRFVKNRLTTDITVFLAKTRENPLTRVTLLDRNLPVILKNFPNNRNKRINLGFFNGLATLVTGRFSMGKNPLQRVAVNGKAFARLRLTQAVHKNGMTYFGPEFHVAIVHGMRSRKTFLFE